MPTKTYTVNVVYSMVHTMYVDAESAEEAKTKAMETFCDEPDFSDDEIDEVMRANVVAVPDDEVKRYPVRYRGHYKNDGQAKPYDKDVGKIEYWTMAKILSEINGDRSENWTPYTEEDWQEGLDEWTEWEPVREESKC